MPAFDDETLKPSAKSLLTGQVRDMALPPPADWDYVARRIRSTAELMREDGVVDAPDGNEVEKFLYTLAPPRYPNL